MIMGRAYEAQLAREEEEWLRKEKKRKRRIQKNLLELDDTVKQMHELKDKFESLCTRLWEDGYGGSLEYEYVPPKGYLTGRWGRR